MFGTPSLKLNLQETAGNIFKRIKDIGNNGDLLNISHILQIHATCTYRLHITESTKTRTEIYSNARKRIFCGRWVAIRKINSNGGFDY